MNLEAIPKIYLSRRNLLALLSKLDRDADGQESTCSIIKNKQPVAAYQQSMEQVMVIAVQDDEYYGSQKRPAGRMIDKDEIRIPQPKTGIL